MQSMEHTAAASVNHKIYIGTHSHFYQFGIKHDFFDSINSILTMTIIDKLADFDRRWKICRTLFKKRKPLFEDVFLRQRVDLNFKKHFPSPFETYFYAI